MASGPAIEKRWGKKGVELADKKDVWELEAYYIAQALVNYILILMPERIIIGGGVSKQRIIFQLIREKVKQFLNEYIPLPHVDEDIDYYIVPPGLDGNSGLIGGFVLGKHALDSQ